MISFKSKSGELQLAYYKKPGGSSCEVTSIIVPCTALAVCINKTMLPFTLVHSTNGTGQTLILK